MRITVNFGPTARRKGLLRVGNVPQGAMVLGTIAREHESGCGALVMLGNGHYVEINDSVIRTVPQQVGRYNAGAFATLAEQIFPPTDLDHTIRR